MKYKIGIIYCGYNTREYVRDSLVVWKNSQYKFLIAAVSLPFKDFLHTEDDGSTQLIQEMGVDYLASSPQYISEAQARTLPLRYLIDRDVDYVWLVDSDEFYTEAQIEAIIEYIEKNENIMWFRLSLKNYVFNEKTFFVQPFQPPRIFKVQQNGYKIAEFFHDNEVRYITQDGSSILSRELPSLTVAPDIAWVKHLCWMNNLRSKHKIEYQNTRGWVCEFAWHSKNGLMLNFNYYKHNGLAIPSISQEK